MSKKGEKQLTIIAVSTSFFSADPYFVMFDNLCQHPHRREYAQQIYLFQEYKGFQQVEACS